MVYFWLLCTRAILKTIKFALLLNRHNFIVFNTSLVHKNKTKTIFWNSKAKYEVARLASLHVYRDSVIDPMSAKYSFESFQFDLLVLQLGFSNTNGGKIRETSVKGMKLRVNVKKLSKHWV